MKKTFSTLAKGTIVAAMSLVAIPYVSAQETEPTVEKINWGDFKLFLDPGHSGTENRGTWGYSEAEKTLGVALNIKDFLETYTTIVDGETLKLCRYDKNTTVGLEERTDMANAWGADFFYSIHSDASGSKNTTLTLFGGWRKDGVEVEKTPNGGKRYGEILNPNLTGVMRITTRGNYYDRCYYDPSPETHTNQYPYLSVNRRSNMPSLLSEGGYHDQIVQQQRNLNDDYKRLEAFAAFQSLMTYRRLELPNVVLMSGVISNSENNQPLNGATITVDGKTYTTDTFESLFNKYTKNPDLIHNGFYLFEGLTPGQEYDVTVEAEGYEKYEGKITMPNPMYLDRLTTTPDYVGFLDISMTNAMPARVASVSAEDLMAVVARLPLEIVFTRNMDRESVEQAFSIDNMGEVTLSWKNDYTLSVDVSKLEPWMQYNIKIDGSIARNSQTNQLLDGDGDGEPGGDYILTIEMAEPDTEAPYVVSTYPEADGEALYTKRPPIRLEFNEELNYNGDKNDGCITLADAEGNDIPGTVTHEVVRDRSVITFYPNEDLPVDAAILVKFEGGIPDLNENTGEPYKFRFLTEYRSMLKETSIHPLNDLADMWMPGGSGSTSGIIEDESSIEILPVGPTNEVRTSFGINYTFDDQSTGTSFFIRDVYMKGAGPKINDFDGVMTMWVYGDGSNNATNVMCRTYKVGRVTTDTGLKYKKDQMRIDFRGWKLYTFDLANDEITPFTQSQTEFIADNTHWCFDSITMTHVNTDDEDPDEVPYQQWTGTVGYNNLVLSAWDKEAVRTASLEDIDLEDSIIDINADNSDAAVEYYNLQGVRVSNPSAGIYIRRQGTKATKVLVK